MIQESIIDKKTVLRVASCNKRNQVSKFRENGSAKTLGLGIIRVKTGRTLARFVLTRGSFVDCLGGGEDTIRYP